MGNCYTIVSHTCMHITLQKNLSKLICRTLKKASCLRGLSPFRKSQVQFLITQEQKDCIATFKISHGSRSGLLRSDWFNEAQKCTPTGTAWCWFDSPTSSYIRIGPRACRIHSQSCSSGSLAGSTRTDMDSGGTLETICVCMCVRHVCVCVCVCVYVCVVYVCECECGITQCTNAHTYVYICTLIPQFLSLAVCFSYCTWGEGRGRIKL